MFNRRSLNSYRKSIPALNTSLKKPYAAAQKLITSGASTKASPGPSKDFSEYIENSSQKENRHKRINTLSISPTPKLNPLRLDFQSDFISNNKRKRPTEIMIREKRNNDLKNSKMSLELKDCKNDEVEFFRLYHENEIMPNAKLNSVISKIECDNDCPTDANQIILAVKYLESQLQLAIELINK